MTVRQARDVPLDAHLHTDQSPDSDVPIDRYAEAAVALGIAEIAITDHVDFEPTAPAYDFVPFATRELVVREAAARWATQGLTIRFGVEVTWDGRFEAGIRSHLARRPYDFVIGSVHIYRDSPYAAPNVGAWVSGRRLPEIVEPYFDAVAAAARSELFDVIGHLDFVKRYLQPYVTAADLAATPELYEPVLRALVDSGTGLEVNTSGLRQAADETYPSAAIVARYRELGGQVVTVGSDAHRADAFAFGLEEGYAAVADAGLPALGMGRRGARTMIVLPDRFAGAATR